MKMIDKDALITEIEDIESSAICEFNSNQSRYTEGCIDVIHHIKSIINTLEVTEVNLEKELDKWMRYGPHTNYPWCTIPDAIKITAEHFFELGLKAQKG